MKRPDVRYNFNINETQQKFGSNFPTSMWVPVRGAGGA
jgi:hypothetical protein